MATYSVTQGRNQRMTFSGSEDQVKITWHSDYFVDVTLGVGETVSQINAYDILAADGVPVVNRTIYEVDNKFIPFVLCRSKSCQPHANSQTRWIVNAQFESSIKANQNEQDNVPIDKPASIFDIAPRVVPILGETQEVLYRDKQDPPVECARTPSGNFWSEPIVERIPVLALQITQYESYISYQELLNRSLKVNKSEYRGAPQYQWLIQKIEPTEVTVPLSSGSVKAVQLTYTIEHSPRTHGWKIDRALIDSQFKTAGGEIKLFSNDTPGSRSLGFITETGLKRASQTGVPSSIQYESYDRIEFNDFLQV